MDSRNEIDLSSGIWDNSAVGKAKLGHGGARPGAGRKRVVQEPERMAVDFERSDLEALRALADEREISVGALVRRAVSHYRRRTKRG